MQKYYRYILTFVILSSVTVALSDAEIRRFEVRLDQGAALIEWETSQENEILSFVLERKTRFDLQFKKISTLAPHGVNNTYRFRDARLGKTGPDDISYRLRIKRVDGSWQTSREINLDYTSTSVQRTWGSIKAMFQ